MHTTGSPPERRPFPATQSPAHSPHGGARYFEGPAAGLPLTPGMVADGLNVVTVRVKDIPAVVVGVVARAKTRRTVVAGTGGKSRRVERVHGRAVRRGERNVYRCSGLAFSDEEVHAPGGAEAHRSLDYVRLDLERGERGLVEAPARRHVTYRDGEVVDEGSTRHGA